MNNPLTTTEFQSAALLLSNAVKGKVKVEPVTRFEVIKFLFRFIGQSLRSIIRIPFNCIFNISLVIVRGKFQFKSAIKYIFSSISSVINNIKDLCFYTICLVLSLIAPKNLLQKIFFMVLKDTLDSVKRIVK